MPLTDILSTQLTDLFRIGLIVALVYTTLRNAAITGQILPLACGVLFVAVIIPATMQTSSAEPLWRLVSVGVVANAIILAVVLGLWTAYLRLRR
jgi:hypothetical protein